MVESCLARIDAVNPRLNAVVVHRPEEARAEAAAIDERRRWGDPLGPLAGVPITIKECFHLTGTPSTIGVPRPVRDLARDDSPLVARLRAAGAIIVGKTNVPQLMLLYESDNPVYGRTNNPWDITRGPGGSSGGEAAAIAAGLAPLGLGNDLGGSIRQPAHVCGIHGLKPTGGRLTNTGLTTVLRGMEAFVSQPGPMARHVEDLSLAMRVLVGRLEPLDLDAPPVPWRDPADVRVDQLRIAYWSDDGFFSPAPAVRRAVEEAAAALRAQGATVERLDPPDVAHAMRLYFGLAGADGARDMREVLGSGPINWQIRRIVRLNGLSGWLRPVVHGLLRMLGERRTAEIFHSGGPISAAAYCRLIVEQREYVRQFYARLAAGRFDAVLTPPFALPALPHGLSIQMFPAASYAMLPNLLDAPAGVVAATRVRPGEESDRSPSRDPSDRAASATEQSSAGLPIGVQVIGWPWREDVVLAVMSALEAHFRRQPDYPAEPPMGRP